MSDVHGQIPGETPHARAVAIAGLLAELGVSSLTLRSAGTTRTLASRTTDLPGELTAAGTCTLEAPGLIIHASPTAARWEAEEVVGHDVRRRLET